MCHQAAGELEQIQFLLGHLSVQTSERYPRCKQRLKNAANGHMGLSGTYKAADPSGLSDRDVVG